MTLDPSRRRPWELNPSAQKAVQKAKIEERLEAVAECELNGFSLRATARALGISPSQVQRDLEIVRQRRMLENISSLGDRLQTSITRRKRLQSIMLEIASNPKNFGKDRIAASAEARAAQDSIDLLEGTTAPNSVNAAALAELVAVFQRIVGEANPQQQQLYQQLLRQELAGSPVGAALLGSADTYYYTYATDVVDQDEESGEEDGENELEDEEIESVEADPEPAPAAQDQQQEEQEIAGDDSEE